MPTVNPKSYIISISLGNGCYRHIQISDMATLAQLHTAIIDAFGFDDDHAHAFFMNNRVWDKTDAYYCDFLEDEERYTSDYKLKKVISGIGHKFVYIFDFGEEWRFDCKVLRETDDFIPSAKLVREKGNPPTQYAGYDDNEFDESEDSFPEAEKYDAKKLKVEYKKLSLSDETVDLLHQYFDAFSNFYEIIPLWKALEIYNSQNEPISEETFLGFAELVEHEEHYYAIFGQEDIYEDEETSKPLDREIVHEFLFVIDFDDYEEIKEEQRGKSYYIPSKEQLLKYTDDFYYEKTPQFLSVRSFLRNMNDVSKETADDCALDLLDAIIMDYEDEDYINDVLERFSIRFKNAFQANEFGNLMRDLIENTRMPRNRGYTFAEIF